METDDNDASSTNEPAIESSFHTFTVAQICGVAGQVVQIPRAAKRNRQTLFTVLESFAPAVRQRIRELAAASVGTKRRAKESAPVARKRARVTRHGARFDSGPVPPARHRRSPPHDCLESRFIDRTGNAALLKHTCMVCARKLFSNRLEETEVENIPNPHHLIPAFPHPSHTLHDGYLLHTAALAAGTTYVCLECKRKLAVDERPPLALANGMWLGDVPFQLQILTLPERLLIALYFPAAYIVKLFPKTKGAEFWDRRSVNSGLKGNVSTYRLNTAQIAGIVSGNTMPPSPAILAATIGPLKVLPDFLRVRRQRTHNHLYTEIEISADQLRLLPEDAVPQEILLNTKHSADVGALEREQAGYVPADAADEEAEFAVSKPGVFPLQAHGVVDVQADGVPDNDILAHGLSNATRPGVQKDFFIRKSSAFVNEYPRLDEEGQRSDGGPANPNHMLGAFPVLFPYGMGGLEVKREQDVPYEAHVRWALQYADAFGVVQKREIKRSAFIANKDFITASGEETRRVPFSNPIIRVLRKQLTSLRARVPGTDESRISIRAQIWGMNLRFNPPSIWATLNLADNSDPIAQVLAGHDIDLDHFIATAGPERSARAVNIASDPFAAAEFFHTTAFGITANRKGKMSRVPGVVGIVNGYIGTVEAQARGTLHLHILFWLQGAPNTTAMKTALETSEFRSKVTSFLKQTIRADIKGTTAETVLTQKKQSSVAYSRPEDPRTDNYELRRHNAEAAVARAVQVHDCTMNTCLKVRGGRLVCKRRAPWPLASEDWIDPSGDWGPRRVFGRLNAWNPTLLQITRSNHDVKLITNGRDTKDITFYITMYIAKKQNQAANASALLAKSMAFQRKLNVAEGGCRDINKRMIQQCANTLSRQQELSGPEVVSYLMGWGDRFISHTFSRIYWDEVTGALRRIYPTLSATK
ncbi:hypothetical protein B0H15DRAFT_924257 [Mycena belliarum]|uniref:Helitron helicase-like domain-containing protein n=1 Tax=Mycena belliarum TaxID=1033014 RepID=A0AAD6XKR4_9AGAR|nr:hypothetical protein B0H15DRAFT_924257 [Mycena belliae]